jgi:hypothetical protein
VSFANYFVDQYNNPQLPTDANYSVVVTPSQAAAAWVTGKTGSGFSVKLAPLLSTATLAAGTFDLVVTQ